MSVVLLLFFTFLQKFVEHEISLDKVENWFIGGPDNCGFTENNL